MNQNIKHRHEKAVSKVTLVAQISVVIFVALVLVGLYFTYSAPTQTGGLLSVQNLTLLSGSASTISSNASCAGDATLEVEITNPTSTSVRITSVVISGSNLHANATALVSGSNFCFPLSESPPIIQSSSSFVFDGYVSAPLAFGDSYHYEISLDSGQNYNGTLVAQV